MKISYQWLQEFVDIDILGLEIEDVGHALTMVGLAVDIIEEFEGDYIFDVDVTTNRVDCLNHLGVARELAAQFRLKLKKPDFSALPYDEMRAQKFPIEVSIEDPELCPRYAARVMSDVTVGESPDWLKKRLESVGQRPINAIVDITNFVLFEIGQPLHAFDYHLLADSKIVVRRARLGERLETLDETVRDLNDSMLLICDGKEAIAVGGVMGGANSEISGASKTILIESAYFDPSSIRKTARKLGLSTEASYRFERGGDPGLQVAALNRACSLIAEISGGNCVSPVIDENPVERSPLVMTLRGKRIAQVLGTPVPEEDVQNIFSCLEFHPEQEDDAIRVEVPSFRRDIELEDDLVEEVARHYGYDRIPSHYPAAIGVGRYADTEKVDRLLISTLVGAGFFEAVNYVFTTPDRETAFTSQPPALVPIANPLTEVDTHLRKTMVPGLIESLKQNLNHGVDDVRLFEMGKTFRPEDSDSSEVHEDRGLALAATGEFYGSFWNQLSEPFDFYHLKGIVVELFKRLRQPVEFRQSSDIAFIHPGMGAELIFKGSKIGVLGALHPRLVESFKFPKPVFLAEFLLEDVYSQRLAEPEYRTLPRFPSVERDLSFVLDRAISFSTIDLAVQALQIAELNDFRLIDLYQGSRLPQDKISLTVRLRFGAASRTLTQEEVSELFEGVVAALKQKFSIEQR
jgi:phenylalanyl-tRNA synthetase beta chain